MRVGGVQPQTPASDRKWHTTRRSHVWLKALTVLCHVVAIAVMQEGTVYYGKVGGVLNVCAFVERCRKEEWP